MASVSLHRLTKTFDAGRPALQDFSLDVRDGEFVVLLGPSGCGKTTALRCIAGLEEPTAGEILIGEREVTHVPPAERDVAMVFQNYALYPHLTVHENIAFALEMRRVPKADCARRVTAMAARLGLAELLDRRPAQLSGGQRQRVALGRAIVRDPAVFLFDEPLSNLDAKLRLELRAELLALHRALGATMIYVTHDQVEAMTMGQRIAILHEGRLRQLGAPGEIYERPADVFVARFVGSPGMNILTGSGTGEGGRVMQCGSLALPVADAAGVFPTQLGLRPEHVGVGAVGEGVGEALVEVVEPLGSETLVHLDAGGQALVARLPGMADVRVGDRVGVRVDTRRLHLFDAAGVRLG
ncbi:MAG: ABC transporter ATP-binding protein [Gemmatimonadetes bacterium]|nr:ABC transporter ATP-binding protein [Gemmatimonadota bacterium]